jgi:osmotically-inducible protein OsmY
MACALSFGALGGCVGPDRGLNGTVDDITIGTEVSFALLGGYGSPIVTVYQGRVLLTGTAPGPEIKAAAEQKVRGVNGVRVIYNEMVVGPPPSINQNASDTWISAQVRSQSLLAVDVRSSNYLVAADRGTVYLLGTASSAVELDRAIQIARYVPGVLRVVSYVDVRPGMPGGGMPPPGPAPYPSASEPPPMAPSPSAPIQVQKL